MFVIVLRKALRIQRSVRTREFGSDPAETFISTFGGRATWSTKSTNTLLTHPDTWWQSFSHWVGLVTGCRSNVKHALNWVTTECANWLKDCDSRDSCDLWFESPTWAQDLRSNCRTQIFWSKASSHPQTPEMRRRKDEEMMTPSCYEVCFHYSMF